MFERSQGTGQVLGVDGEVHVLHSVAVELRVRPSRNGRPCTCTWLHVRIARKRPLSVSICSHNDVRRSHGPPTTDHQAEPAPTGDEASCEASSQNCLTVVRE